MDYSWFESLLVGVVMGLTDILPVSASAHTRLLLKLIGKGTVQPLMRLMIHLAIFAALYLCCQPQILKMVRARNLARIPKKKRKRPLDIRSMMDLSLLKTMVVPAILGVVLYNKVGQMISNQIIVATFFFLNGLLLYIPQYLPSSNKDCRTLSRVEGLLMGLAAALNCVPGLSGMGAALSAASVTGVDSKYGLNMILLMHMGVTAGMAVLDIVEIFQLGVKNLSVLFLLLCIIAAAAAFAAAWGAVKILRNLSVQRGYSVFSYYCWGLALFTFVLTLMA